MLNIARNMYWKPDQQILSLPNLKIIYLLLDSFEGAVNTLRCYLPIGNRVRIYHGNYKFLEKFSTGIQKKVEPISILYNPDYCWKHKFFFQGVTYWDVIVISGFYFHCETVQSNGPSKHAVQTRNVTQLRQPKNWYYIERKFGTHC
jgi:hypothetical protein